MAMVQPVYSYLLHLFHYAMLCLPAYLPATEGVKVVR